jgi:hypothetical protein
MPGDERKPQDRFVVVIVGLVVLAAAATAVMLLLPTNFSRN